MNYQSRTNASSYEGLPVNNGSNDQYSNYECILQTSRELLEQMIVKHSKVLFIRFDVHYPQDYWDSDSSNAKISLLLKRLNNHYSYHGVDCEYLCVRERSTEKHQHYHVVLLMDGNLKEMYIPILEKVETWWGKILNCNEPKGLIFYCNKDSDGVYHDNGIMIVRPSRKLTGEKLAKQNMEFEENVKKCMEWMSYLAKVNQKMNTPAGYRKFNASKFDKPTDRLWSGVELNGQLFDNLRERGYKVHIPQL